MIHWSGSVYTECLINSPLRLTQSIYWSSLYLGYTFILKFTLKTPFQFPMSCSLLKYQKPKVKDFVFFSFMVKCNGLSYKIYSKESFSLIESNRIITASRQPCQTCDYPSIFWIFKFIWQDFYLNLLCWHIQLRMHWKQNWTEIVTDDNESDTAINMKLKKR